MDRFRLCEVAANADIGSLPEIASEKNQLMDNLLNRPQIPSDYGDTMVGPRTAVALEVSAQQGCRGFL